jgi:hypothetical protein
MASLDSLLKQLGSVEPGNMDLFIRIKRACLKEGRSFDEVKDYISAALYRELDEAQIELLNSGDEKSIVYADIQKGNPLADLIVAQHFLAEFRLSELEGQVFLFKVTSAEDKTVLPLYEKDYVKILKRELSIRWLEQTGEPIAPARAGELVQYWFNHEQNICMPEPMGLLGDNKWCLHRSKYFPDPSVEYPSWQRILDRMSDAEAFAAWQYGVWAGIYKGRQFLWLHGPNGEDGKSALARVIGQNLYGPAHNAISNASISSSEKRFLTSFFENAALVVYPDANNRRCLMSEAFKTVASAGSDPVLIERKGKQAYTATLKAYMWISSNYAPEVTNNNFITSRLLYIHIGKMVNEKPDPTVFKRLEAELSGFLSYAKYCYEKLCADNYKIETNDSTIASVSDFTEDFYEEYSTIFTKYWEQADIDEHVPANKVRDLLKIEGFSCNRKYGDFTRWMIEQLHIVKWKDPSNGGLVFYKGMKPKGAKPLTIADKPQF